MYWVRLFCFSLQALALMPSDAMVCLITFGAMCMLHEIADASEYNKVHVFHGSRELSSSSVRLRRRQWLRMFVLACLLYVCPSVSETTGGLTRPVQM